MKILRFILLLISMALLIYSCSIEKRVYRPGWHGELYQRSSPFQETKSHYQDSLLCDSARTIVLSSRVGSTIDSLEKATYRLFPYWSADKFKYAQICNRGNGNYSLLGKMKDGTLKEIKYKEAEIKLLIDQIESKIIVSRDTSLCEPSKTILITPKVGNVIDKSEMKKYQLFSNWAMDNFLYAQICDKGNGNYVVLGKMKDGSVKEINYKKSEITHLRNKIEAKDATTHEIELQTLESITINTVKDSTKEKPVLLKVLSDSAQLISLSEQTGRIIDAKENSKFNLFPFWNKKNFENAQVYKQDSGRYILIGEMKNGKIERVLLNEEDINKLKEKIPPPIHPKVRDSRSLFIWSFLIITAIITLPISLILAIQGLRAIEKSKGAFSGTELAKKLITADLIFLISLIVSVSLGVLLWYALGLNDGCSG